MHAVRVFLVVGVWSVTLAAVDQRPTGSAAGQRRTPAAGQGQSAQAAPERASFVFLGTVSTANVPGTGPGARLVRVDRIYFRRGTFDVRTGSEVIVAGGRVPSGGQYVFHVEPYQFGARVHARLLFTEARRQYSEDEVKRLTRTMRKEDLAERVRGAGLIAIGSVESTREWRGRERTESEHDPHLTVATARITEALRGRPDGPRVEFLFAASDDVQWYRAPKPRPGVSAAFLLRRAPEGLGPEVAQSWTVLHPDDMLQGEDVQIVREIVREGGAK